MLYKMDEKKENTVIKSIIDYDKIHTIKKGCQNCEG